MLAAMVRPPLSYVRRHKRILHLGLRASRQRGVRAPFTVPEFAYFPSALCAPLTVPVGPCQTARAAWLLVVVPVNRLPPIVTRGMRRGHERSSRGRNSVLGGNRRFASPLPETHAGRDPVRASSPTSIRSPNPTEPPIRPAPHYPIASSSEGPANTKRVESVTRADAVLGRTGRS